jgi:chaperone modulatory protein CbpM
MANSNVMTGVLLDDVELSVDELAHACAVAPDWVVRQVQAGVLGGALGMEVTGWRFNSGDLSRARRLLRIERDFDANEDIAALVLDLGEEIRRLRTRLYVLGVK